MKYTLEICCDHAASVDAAIEGGASRIELCAALTTGGITPSAALIEYAVKISKTPVFVLIRPRAGNFVYSKTEKEILYRDIEMARSMGVSGIVSGALNSDGTVDEETSSRIVQVASPLPCTFHRAFDFASDLPSAMETIIRCGFHRILTSGGKNSAKQGINELKSLNQSAAGRICLLAGGGINDEIIKDIALNTGILEFHASAKITFSGKLTYKENISKIAAPALCDENDFFLTDALQVKALLKVLRTL